MEPSMGAALQTGLNNAALLSRLGHTAPAVVRTTPASTCELVIFFGMLGLVLAVVVAAAVMNALDRSNYGDR